VVYRRLTVQSARPTGDDPRYFRAARPRPDDLTAMRQMSRNIPTVSRRWIHPGASNATVLTPQTTSMTIAATIHKSIEPH